jgi:2-(1,2-epoxy-1,2-dihydrophenyl)acetyl-CoA isomerase
MDDILKSSLDDGVLTLTLNRPDSLNGITITLVRLLNEATREAARSPDVRVVVLTGAGRAFSAGGDIKEFDAIDEGDPLWVRLRNDPVWNGMDSCIDRYGRAAECSLLLHEMPKPTIAMVRGPCVGAALSLATACDFRFASDTAMFSSAFAKIGVSGEMGQSYFLTKALGSWKAREILFLSERIKADEAARIGLVNKVVADADLERETMAFARRLAKGPPLAYRYLKENINAAEIGRLDDTLRLEATNQMKSLRSEDAKEAIDAFFKKREPSFRGL